MMTSLKSKLLSAALVPVLIGLWIWSNSDQDQTATLNTLNNRTVEQLLHEVRLLKAMLAEMKGRQLNLAANTSLQPRPVVDNLELIDQMREMIRTELNTTSHQVSRDHMGIDLRQTPDPERQSEAETISVAIIDTIIASGGALSDTDRSRLQELSPHLSEQVKHELRHRIVMAINRQELQLEEPLDLPF